MAIVAATQNGVLVQILNAFYRLSLAVAKSISAIRHARGARSLSTAKFLARSKTATPPPAWR